MTYLEQVLAALKVNHGTRLVDLITPGILGAEQNGLSVEECVATFAFPVEEHRRAAEGLNG